MSTQHQNECEQFLSGLFLSPFSDDKKYHKFDSTENRQAILNHLLSFGITPSTTSVRRAILELVEEGQIDRVDGLNEADDTRAAAQAEEARQRKIAESTPLTPELCSQFAAMSPADVSRRYYKERAFKLLYDRACALWGFRVPEPRA
jgi:hypothetical protein